MVRKIFEDFVEGRVDRKILAVYNKPEVGIKYRLLDIDSRHMERFRSMQREGEIFNLEFYEVRVKKK